jgi:pantoate--beta-alanine ligase
MTALATSALDREMVVTADVAAVRREVAAARARGETIGVVPTMGALHDGHLSLVTTACEECEFVVATIFVNPTQFGPHEDLDRYPRPRENDLDACRRRGVDLVFEPAAETVYPESFSTYVEMEGLSDVLESKFRPGHFRGVATVVLKLLNIVQPDLAYFGRKDYQQQTLVRRMCTDLELPVDVRICPTVREADGLALSSRNRYLSPSDREKALSLSQSLMLAKRRLSAGETDVAAVRQAMLAHLESVPGVDIDYATVADAVTLEELTTPRTEMVALVAAHVGGTRLIDNLPISQPPEL